MGGAAAGRHNRYTAPSGTRARRDEHVKAAASTTWPGGAGACDAGYRPLIPAVPSSRQTDGGVAKQVTRNLAWSVERDSGVKACRTYDHVLSRREAGGASRERSARHARGSSRRTGPSRRPAVTMVTGPVLLTHLAVSPRMGRPLTTHAVWCTRAGARGHLRRSRTQRSVATCSTPVVGHPIILGRGHAIHVRDEEEPIVRPYQTTPTGTRARQGTARVVRRHYARH